MLLLHERQCLAERHPQHSQMLRQSSNKPENPEALGNKVK
jgi:hypothetical protein